MNDDLIKELEARVIERAKFWDGYIEMLIRLRDAGICAADKARAWNTSVCERQLSDGLQQAIDAALQLQRKELAECVMLAGAGGERALEYARQRARDILGEKALEFAGRLGLVPTYWTKGD